jgi:2-polyprenyl-3-methyl-5-hydroxy-6-metoxy-1,4-benzoquinol methylase
MDANDWNIRYDQTDLRWSSGPNQWIVQVTASLAPGRVLDLAAGGGRIATWLDERGWSATAVDFSAVALERAPRRSRRAGCWSSQRTTPRTPITASAARPTLLF